jgi:hypothetical protein
MISYGLVVILVIASLFIGAVIGVVLLGLCTAAGEADDKAGYRE